MLRKIIKINEEKCNGCGLCVDACHEGALGIVDGKAKLLREDYCDGLGDCLPTCPTGAITFEEREAPEYNETAVLKNQQKKSDSCTCPGSNIQNFTRSAESVPTQKHTLISELQQWPVQIKLTPVNASFFDGANLLIAADCAAYARASFHSEFMSNKITLIGCPKLDSIDYSKRLTEIISNNDIKSLTIVRMEVPCCSGIEQAVVTALKNSSKFIPWQVVTLGTDGAIKEV